jgi:phage-related protein
LKSLAKEDKLTIGEDMKTIEYGWPIGMPLVRKMDTNLWEVRCHISGGQIARVLFTVYEDIMVLLHGFIKKSQKTPNKDLTLAKQRRNTVLNERVDHE